MPASPTFALYGASTWCHRPVLSFSQASMVPCIEDHDGVCTTTTWVEAPMCRNDMGSEGCTGLIGRLLHGEPGDAAAVSAATPPRASSERRVSSVITPVYAKAPAGR